MSQTFVFIFRIFVILSIKQYSGMVIFPAIIISHMGSLRDHRPDALIMKFFLLICKGVMNGEMQCVIANENLAISYLYDAIK
jgi:hypothetical protein